MQLALAQLRFDVEFGSTNRDAMNKKIMLVALIAVIFGVVAGGTVILFYPGDESEGEVVDENEVVVASAKAIYYTMRKPFIVNSTKGNRSRYLQLDLVLMARDNATIESLMLHTPSIRGQIINLLVDEDFLVLSTHEGKQDLRKELKQLINDTLKKESAEGAVESVLFNNFVMQ